MNDWSKPRTIFALMFYGIFCYLIIRQFEVPPTLNTIISSLLGYWYGSKKVGKNEQLN